MSVRDFAEPNTTATRLAWADGDPPEYTPSGVAFDVAALPASGSEKVSIGKEISRDVLKVFCDLLPDESAPVGTKDRVRVEGFGDHEILSIQRFTFGENIAIVMCERYA